MPLALPSRAQPDQRDQGSGIGHRKEQKLLLNAPSIEGDYSAPIYERRQHEKNNPEGVVHQNRTDGMHGKHSGCFLNPWLLEFLRSSCRKAEQAQDMRVFRRKVEFDKNHLHALKCLQALSNVYPSVRRSADHNAVEREDIVNN